MSTCTANTPEMSQDEQAGFPAQSQTPELPHARFDRLYEDDDLIDDVVSLDTPIKQEEELFDQFGSPTPSPAVYEFPLPDPSTTGEGSNLEPSITTDQATPGPSSTPLPAPIPSRPRPENHFLNGTNFSNLEESAYDYYPSMTPPTFNVSNWWDYPCELSPNTAPTMSGSIAPVQPSTPVPEYITPELLAPGYTPGVCTRELLAPLDDNNPRFNVAVQELPMPIWNAYQELGHIHQSSSVPHVPNFSQTVGSQSGLHPWDDIAQVFESDQPQAPPPPSLPAQNPTLAALEQLFGTLNANVQRQGSNQSQLVGVGLQFWFTPS